MWIKKLVTSLICMVTMILLCSTYSYAAINDSDIRIDLEQNLIKFEKVFSTERSHYNLDDNDIIENNLQIGGIYPNNTININININTDAQNLSKILKNNNKYVSTIKLKDSNKPIALVFIEKKDSKWIISRMNSYNLLDDEVENYKKTVDNNPIVIIDQANQIYALVSEQNKDNITIIETNHSLSLKSGQSETMTDLLLKLKERKAVAKNITTGIASPENTTTFNYSYILIPLIVLASIVILFIVFQKHSKDTKT